jgi:YaiO family outer membrane protein
MAVIRFAATGIIYLLAALTLDAPPAAAHGAFYVEGSADHSPVDFGTAEQLWQAGRISGGWLEEGRSGWNVSVERQTRGTLSDWGVSTRGFRHTGDWTFNGGLGLSADPQFSYRRSFEGEIGRTIAGSLVAHGGYRYLDFSPTTVHLIQPGATLYFPRGDIGARYFLVRNDTRETTTGTLLTQGSIAVHPRLRLGGGAAFGERIFDVASLATPHANAWVGYGFARFTASPQWGIDIGFGRAHEDPMFSQRTLTVGVRRTFGRRP